MRRRILLTALLAVFGLTTIAAANTLVVPSAQYPTIQSAINAANPGDQICVLPGTYAEAIDFYNGTSKMDVHVFALAGPTVTTIDVTTIGAPAVTFQSGNGPGAIIEGFTITSTLKERGVFVTNGSTPTIRGNHFYKLRPPGGGNGGAILINGGSSALIEGNRFEGCIGDDGAAIDLSEDQADIINNEFISNTAIGNFAGSIITYGSNANAVINVVGNLFVGNRTTKGGGGVIFGTKGTLRVINNTMTNNFMPMPSPTVEPRQSATVEVINNILWNSNGFELPTTTSYVVDYNIINDSGWQNGTNISTPPKFLDAANGDYRSAPSSPAIEAGTLTLPITLPAEDLEGDPRLVDGDGNAVPDPDIGHDEFDALAYLPAPVKAGSNATWTYLAPPVFNGRTVFGFLSAGDGSGTTSGQGIPLNDGSGRYLALDNDGWFQSSQLVPMVQSATISAGMGQTQPFTWIHNQKGKTMYYAGIVMDLSTGQILKVLPTCSFQIQ